ncbi:MAG: hypothetical protein ABI488_17110 [Polyangiaceae bacterium]
MSYSWEVGPGNAGAMHSAHWRDLKHPTSSEVRFRASNATLRALKAKLIKDDCCAAFRASTCRAFDAPPATIAFSMGDLQCAARATPECTEERAARRCFDHLEGFLRAACGARCK